LLFTVTFIASVLTGQVVNATAPLPPLTLSNLPTSTRFELQRAYDSAAAAPADASASGRLAMLLHAHEQYESAQTCYRRAGELDPTALRWKYLAGVVAAELNAYADALRALREALALDPDYLPARLRLADALFRLGDLQASRAEHAALQRQYPDLALALYGGGRIAWVLGEHDAAIKQYRRATQVSPPFGSAHYALALALRATGLMSEADAHFAAYRRWGARKPVPHDPILDDVRALNGTARELLVKAARLGKAGLLDASIELHLRALAIDPTAAQAHVNLISLFGRNGQTDLSEAHYQRALKLGTSLDEAHYNYGVLLGSIGQLPEAAAAFQRTLDVNPFHAGAHSNLGAIFAREGKIELAASHYLQTISNNPAHTAARMNLARLLAVSGDREQARERFEQALQRAKALGETDLASRIEQELQTLAAVRR
jgi:tetratricopeptide (TPR) repeat protein